MAQVRRILLVDDEPSATDILGRLLRRAGFEVEIVGSTADALAAAELSHFDLVITDMQLPDRPGNELMQDLAKKGNVPAIGLSGWSEQDIDPAHLALFSSYLVKPVDFQKLLAAVDRALKT
jgi:DNA-binding response OmpR family regulator